MQLIGWLLVGRELRNQGVPISVYRESELELPGVASNQLLERITSSNLTLLVAWKIHQFFSCFAY